jgi:hypothetical protein
VGAPGYSPGVSEAVDKEVRSVGARDAFILVSICVPPEKVRQAGHARRDAFVVRLIGVRSSMRRLERRGYLEPGWSVDDMGAHCDVTERGTAAARALALPVTLAPYDGGLSTAKLLLRMLLNRPMPVDTSTRR